ncbi:hypothetical protein VPH35_096648 [Triticum aestivum]
MGSINASPFELATSITPTPSTTMGNTVLELCVPPTTFSRGCPSGDASDESALTSYAAAPSSMTTIDIVPELTATGGCSEVAHTTCSTTGLDLDTGHILVAEVPLLMVDQFLAAIDVLCEIATSVGKLTVEPPMAPPTTGSVACSESDEGVSPHVPSRNQCSPAQWKPPWPIPSQGIFHRLFMGQPYGNLNYYATRITVSTSGSYDHHYFHMEFGSFSLELLSVDECWKYWNCEPGNSCASTEESDAELLEGLVSSVVPYEQHHSIIAFENLLGAPYWVSDMHLRVSYSFWPHMQQFSDNGWLSFEVELSVTDMVLLPMDTIQLQIWPPPSSIHLVEQFEYGAPLKIVG